ncbi:MAG: ABC transporter ATP-binding protein [Acidimicrobiales bacterium]
MANSGVSVENMLVEVADGRQKRTIIDDLSFEALPGKITALTGPSGSGKTTVLSCLAGVAKFQGGHVVVGGKRRKPKTLATASELRETGIIFQDYRLVKALNVVDNVALTLTLEGMSWKLARSQAKHILSQLGLGDRFKNRPSSLSGGEQQRVALARAIIGQAEVLLADEPSAHLDKDSAELLLSYLLGMAVTGTCVVVSSHDPRLLSHCNDVVSLG